MKQLAKRPRYGDDTPKRNPAKRATIRSDKRAVKQLIKKDIEAAVADTPPVPIHDEDDESSFEYDADFGGAYHSNDQVGLPMDEMDEDDLELIIADMEAYSQAA